MCAVKTMVLPAGPLAARLAALVASVLAGLAVGQQPARAPRLEPLRELTLTGAAVHSLCFAPDGALLATGGDLGEVLLLDAVSGAVRQRLRAEGAWIEAIAFSPDGARLAAVGRDLTVWDLASGTLLARLDSGSTRALDWSRDGSLLAFVVDRHTVGLLELDGRGAGAVRPIPLADDTAADCVALSPDASRLAVGKRSGSLQTFDVATGASLATASFPDWTQDLGWPIGPQPLRLGRQGHHVLFDGHSETGPPAVALRAQADGSRIAIRTRDAIVLRAASGATLELAGDGPVALHPDGEHWARALGPTIEVLRGAEPLRRFDAAHRARPILAVLTGDGRFVAAKGRGVALAVFGSESGEPVAPPPVAGGAIPLANRTRPELTLCTPAGRIPTLEYWLPATPGGPLRVQSLELSTRARIGPAQQVQSGIRLGADGRTLTLGDLAIDLARPTEPLLDLDRVLMATLAIAPDGELFAGIEPTPDSFGGGIGGLRVVDRAGRERLAVRLAELPLDVAFTADGRALLVATNRQLHSHAVPELHEVRTFPLRWSRLAPLTGDLVLAAAADAVVLWRHGDAEPLAELATPAPVLGLATSGDGRTAVATLADRLLLLRVAR
ncbi:MAG: hypothetical protein IPM29_27015 [Planctomycetes bacterium]|nr:hypothetical protein [Planctomycetota bacterium]